MKLANLVSLVALTAVFGLGRGLRAETPAVSTQFRGPNANGYVADSLPARWKDSDSSEGRENIAWSSEIPGGGWSSPVIAGNRVFVTTAVSPEYKGPKGFSGGVASMAMFYMSRAPKEPLSFEVLCLSLEDGKLLWQTPVTKKKVAFKIHPSNSYATESPVVSDRYVYAYYGAAGVVACLDFDGNVVWERDLGSFRTSNDFGTGSSLAILDGQVYVQCDNDEQSFIVALNAETGSEIWKDERSSGTSWSSPVIWPNDQRRELIVCGSDGVTSYQPQTGEKLWKLTGTGGAFSATPTFDSQRLYFGQSGRNSRGPLIAISTQAEGEMSVDSDHPGIAWKTSSSAPGMCSPVVVGERVFVLSQGILGAHDANTGKRLSRERLKNASSVTASLWAGGERLYVLNESGETTVIDVNSLDALETNKVPGLYWSTPAFSGNTILIREAGRLYCIRD